VGISFLLYDKEVQLSCVFYKNVCRYMQVKCKSPAVALEDLIWSGKLFFKPFVHVKH
jgi:hypothetical protein